MDPTVELTEQDERDWQAERQEDIASICWQKCSDCNGQGFYIEHWPSDDDGPDYVLKPTCLGCDGQRRIQLHDPQRIGALFAAADDARDKFGVWCYTRIASALSLAIDGAVDLASRAAVESATIRGKVYSFDPHKCTCYDAHYRAPRIDGIPHCKHQIAVWLVKTAEKKMSNG